MPGHPDAPDAPGVSAVVVSYNTAKMTLDCLKVLTGELAGCPAEILVVDNASTDGSAEAVRATFPDVRLQVSPRNMGFGVANNMAFAQARGRYLLLLNSDAFPRPGTVAALRQYLDTHADVGVVGPRLVYPDGKLQRSCFRFTTPLQAWLENLWLTRIFADSSSLGDYRDWNHATERDVDFMIGACLLVRRTVYEQVGGFDERFFMYQEEADWQCRIKAAGWRVVFTPTAEVMHIAGASGKDEPVQINEHFFDSLDKYLLKHHGIVGFLLLRAAMIVGCLLRFFGWAMMALGPRRRQGAGQRARRHAWLLARQLFKGRPSSSHV